MRRSLGQERRILEKERRLLARMMAEEARDLARAPLASSQGGAVLSLHGLWDKLYRIEDELIALRQHAMPGDGVPHPPTSPNGP